MTRSRIPEDDEGGHPEEGPLVAQAVGMLVERAESRLENADTLAEALRDLIIPQTFGTDLYDPDGDGATVSMSPEDDGDDSGDETFLYDSMVKFFLYKGVKDISDNKLQDELDKWPHRAHWFGADRAPRQQTFSYTWDHRFTPQTRHAIEVAAEAIGNVAADEGVIREALAPRNITEDDTDDEGTPKREVKREQANATLKLARRHLYPSLDTGRADNRKYSERDLGEMHARMCTTKVGAHSEGEIGWLTDDDYTPDCSTFLRAIKGSFDGYRDEQLTLDRKWSPNDPDLLREIHSIRDEEMETAHDVIGKIVASVEGEDVINERKTVVSIDTTKRQFHVWPWEDKEEGISKEGFPPMVSGYKEGGEFKRGYKYGTIGTTDPNTVPLPLGIEPLKHNSKWEPDDAPSHSDAGLVDRLLTQAERHVDPDIVLFDRGLQGDGVQCVVEKHGVTYVAPKPKYTDEWEDIKSVQEHPTADGAVKHGVEVSANVGEDHEAEQIYVPSESDDADGSYAVFMTNHGHVKPNEIHHWPNIYKRRWDIEIKYKTLHDFLPRTSSTDFRVRFHNFVFSALVYALWRLTDFLIKVAIDEDIRAPPVLTANTFAQMLGNFRRKRKYNREYD